MKVRFQSPAIASKYTSTFQAIDTIIREERFIGLYKGVTSPLVRSHAVIHAPTLTRPSIGDRGFDEWSCVRFLSFPFEVTA